MGYNDPYFVSLGTEVHVKSTPGFTSGNAEIQVSYITDRPGCEEEISVVPLFTEDGRPWDGKETRSLCQEPGLVSSRISTRFNLL
jgi:hypothetical protein